MLHRTLGVCVVVLSLAATVAAAPTVQYREQSSGLSSINLDPSVPHQITLEVYIIPEAGATNKVGGVQTRIFADKPGLSYEPAQVSGVNMLNYVSPYDQNAYNGIAYGLSGAGDWLVRDPEITFYPLLDEDGNLVPLPGGPLPAPFLASARTETNSPHVFAWVTINVPANAAFPITVYPQPYDLGVGTTLFRYSGAELPLPNLVPLVLNAPEPGMGLSLLAGLSLVRRRADR
jgi:hypothetical protein